jgi:hypothetical protein
MPEPLAHPPTARVSALDPMPVFTIKAKDRLAVHAVTYYRHLCATYGLDEQGEEVCKVIAEMLAWRRRNPHLVHMPDHAHVPATARSSEPRPLTLAAELEGGKS